MNIIRKDATITPVGDDDAFPGQFEVVLSAPTEDRDGETLTADGWKQPLPDHITFDSDHGMSVATTVGSGVPTLNDAGELVVAGTYSSLPRAQEVRTLVNEGHIRTTSVAYMTDDKSQKDGKPALRELLNGAFVAIPSNREALVLASKAVKAGARNNATDAGTIQSIHDAAATLGADCSGAKSFIPQSKADAPAEGDPSTIALTLDDALSQALTLLAGLDVESLPAEAQQAITLLEAADVASDELLGALGVPDPDEDESLDPAEAEAAAPAKAAAPAETEAADDDELQTRVRALALSASTYADEVGE